MSSLRTACLSALASLVLAACAGGNPIRNYDKEMAVTVQQVKQGHAAAALAELEKNNQPGMLQKDKDILYYFEKGQLLSLDSQYADAQKSWLAADEMVSQWENDYRTDPARIMGEVGSFLINDKTRRYEGQDYEKVMLSVDLMLAEIMQGKYDAARVEMKKTVERETLIGEYREKEYDSLQEKAKTLDITNTLGDLQGYPMASLDSPEVTALKNGYQNAFAHYLAGFYFEAAGEDSLAAPGYRNAVALAPNSALAQAGLANLEGGRRLRPGAGEADVLFVIESGFAPSWKSTTIPIPVMTKGKKAGVGQVLTHSVIIPLSFPTIVASGKTYVPAELQVGGKVLPVDTLVNIDAMARRQLKDQFPGILLRTVIRGALKAEAQKGLNSTGVIGATVGKVAATLTEQADDRSWRTLPERIAVARAILPQGENLLEFRTASGAAFRTRVTVGSRFSIIPIRLTGGPVLVGTPSVLGDLPVPAVAEAAPVVAPVATPARQPAGKRHGKGTAKEARAAGATKARGEI